MPRDAEGWYRGFLPPSHWGVRLEQHMGEDRIESTNHSCPIPPSRTWAGFALLLFLSHLSFCRAVILVHRSFLAGCVVCLSRLLIQYFDRPRCRPWKLGADVYPRVVECRPSTTSSPFLFSSSIIRWRLDTLIRACPGPLASRWGCWNPRSGVGKPSPTQPFPDRVEGVIATARAPSPGWRCCASFGGVSLPRARLPYLDTAKTYKNYQYHDMYLHPAGGKGRHQHHTKWTGQVILAKTRLPSLTYDARCGWSLVHLTLCSRRGCDNAILLADIPVQQPDNASSYHYRPTCKSSL